MPAASSVWPVAAVQALIIVDVQTGFVTGDAAVPDADRLLAGVASLLVRARRAGSLIVHLQNDGAPGEADEPGTPGWALHLAPEAAELVIRKTEDDGFRDTNLGSVLTGQGIRRLAIAGLLSEMCVSATARHALRRGFEVVLPHDAHATYDIPAVAGLGPGVPAAAVARVAEWALGDEAEIAPSAEQVTFASPCP
jgi:nicotinamidase-related amidase